MMNGKRNIEVCLSTALFPLFNVEGSIVVVVDTLRATSVICTMFKNGVEEVIPVKTIEEAKEYKEKGYLVVAERDGKKLDFADFGNSPDYFVPEVVDGKTLVYSTTNGTNAITLGKDAHQVLVGSFLNLDAVVNHLKAQQKNVFILCSGWKGKFNLEDTIFAGAVAEALLKEDEFTTICDSTHAATDLWGIAKGDLVNYVNKAAQKERLRKMGFDSVIPYCHTPNQTNVLPVYRGGKLVDIAEK